MQMDVQRVRTAPALVRQEMNMAVQPLVQTGRDASNWRGQNAQQPPPNAMVVAQQPEKKKMSWWPWSKKTCIRCSQKLHKTWTQCPYCGQDQNAPVMGGPAPGAQPGAPGAPGYPPAPGMPYGQPGAPGPMPTPGMPMKTIAMDAAAINAPLLASGDRSENVAWMVPLDGPLTGELLQVKGKAVIGTAEGCDIRVFDASISGRHCELTVGQGGRFRITDLGSRNGTYVNDKTIASVELVDGDNIRLGRTTFRFKTKN
ncbi:MAG: FHA domain-containing protein [Myxococcales bacterium]|nr:FHA domain-containing protein [Myxococcales bacterium]